MRGNNIIVIHPLDASTDFLMEIVESLISQFESRVTLIRPHFGFKKSDLHDSLNELYKSNDLIIFLGHGNSYSLFGAVDATGNKTVLFTREEVYQLFELKRVICFSCYSGELLRRTNNILEYIGFGNMPTGWMEILSERDLGDTRYLTNLGETSLQYYRQFLVDILKKAIINVNQSFGYMREIYLNLRLEINKHLILVPNLKDLPIHERVELFNMIHQTKKDLFFK